MNEKSAGENVKQVMRHQIEIITTYAMYLFQEAVEQTSTRCTKSAVVVPSC